MKLLNYINISNVKVFNRLKICIGLCEGIKYFKIIQ
jgi:hypothetical protein